MIKIVLLNGPPGSGKDEIAKQMMRSRRNSGLIHKFAHTVKVGCHGLFNLLDEKGRVLPHDYFEEMKEIPSDRFMGMTPREAYIWYSEDVMKPKFGKSIFGNLTAERIRKDVTMHGWNRHTRGVVFISDSGFYHEALAMQFAFGDASVCLVNVKAPGCTYKGDSRSYIDLPGSRQITLENRLNGLDRLRNEAESVLFPFLNS